MAGDYDKLTPALRALDLLTRFKLYSGAAYKADGTLAEQAGLGEGGTDFNFTAFKADFAETIELAKAYAASVVAAEIQTGAWKDMGWTVDYVNAHTFTASGDQTAFLIVGRAIQVTLDDLSIAYALVVDATYDLFTGHTTCVLNEEILTSGLSIVKIGQDPRNAPKSRGGDPVLASIYHTSSY